MPNNARLHAIEWFRVAATPSYHLPLAAPEDRLGASRIQEIG